LQTEDDNNNTIKNVSLGPSENQGRKVYVRRNSSNLNFSVQYTTLYMDKQLFGGIGKA
jgi:hypothetical protein